MKKCPNCDADIEDLRTACPFCGTYVREEAKKEEPQFNQNNNNNYNYNNYSNRPMVNDSGSFGYWLLGFFIPLIGLILFFVWKNEQPNNAKRALWGALVSMIASFVISIISFICVIIGIMLNGGM